MSWQVRVLWTLALTGCGNPLPEPEGQVLERDSAGVVISEARGRLWVDADRWSVASDPSLSIGKGLEGEEPYLFSYIHNAIRLADGRVVVLDESPDRTVRVFDSDGHHLANWGGAGGGPGEFGLPPYAVFAGAANEIVVPEFGAVRATRFDSAGRFVGRAALRHDWQIDRQERVAASSCCQFREVLPDGSWLVAYPEEVAIAGTGLRRGEQTLVRFSPEGDLLGRFLVYPGGLWSPSDGGRPTRVLLTGGLATAIGGGYLFVGNGARFHVDVYNVDGSHVRSIRVDQPPRAFDPQLRNAYIERRVASLARMQGEAEAERRRHEIERTTPEELPAFSAILHDPLGHLWLIAPSVPGAEDLPRTASILRADGAYLGSVDLPAGMRPLQAGDSWILGVSQDEWGVNRIVLHRIVKPAS